MDAGIGFTLVTIVVVAFGWYLKHYIAEMARNMATNKSIGEFTKKVEEIKTEFIRETEKLKLQIGYRNQIKFSIKTEEIKALLDCHQDLVVWMNTLSNFSFADYNENNLDDISKVSGTFDIVYNKFSLSEGRLWLMIDKDEIVQKTTEIKQVLHEYSSYTTKSIIEYKYQFITYTSERDSLQGETKFEKTRKWYAESLEHHKIFNEERMRMYERIIGVYHPFRKRIYAMLNEMAAEQAN
jgi:hypothetical protein